MKLFHKNKSLEEQEEVLRSNMIKGLIEPDIYQKEKTSIGCKISAYDIKINGLFESHFQK